MIDAVTLNFWDPTTYHVHNPNLFSGNIRCLGTHEHTYNYEVKKTYYPRVKIVKYIDKFPKRQVTYLQVKVSLPKLIYGNNLVELTDADFPVCCDKLSDVLNKMGISITSQQIANCADVRGFEYGKNILLGHIPVPLVLSELSRGKPLNSFMDIERVSYRNGGEKLSFYSPGYEVIFYDKTKELQKEIRRPKCQLPKDLKTMVIKNKINVLRMELRFHRRKSWQQLLYPYDKNIRRANFKSVFRQNISRAILLDYWYRISKKARKTPMNIFDPAFELWRITQGTGKKLKPKALLAKLGTNYLMREAGYHKSVRILKHLGFSNPSDFIKRNTGSICRINWRCDIWRFIDRSLSRFTLLTPNKWINLKKRTSAVWCKKYEPLLTVKEIAYQLNVSTRVVLQEIHRKRLPAHRIGKSVFRISRAAFVTYLNRDTK